MSFIVQAGGCAHCGEPIGRHHLLVELVVLLQFVAAVAVAGPVDGLVLGGLGTWLTLLALIDLRSLTLPDALTLPLIAAGLLIAAGSGSLVTLEAAGLGALVGYSGFAVLGWAYRRWRGVDGLGLGDAKLVAAAGAWLGPMPIPQVVLVGALATLAVALVRGAHRRPHLPIPFGPGLAFGFWLVALAGLS